MDNLNQKINQQLEKLKYLEGTRDKNLQILNNRVREIKEKQKNNHNNK
jgi:hypothetical protein